MATILNIIKDAVQSVLLLDRDDISTDVRDMCLAIVNTQGKIIFDSWPWDNSKIDEFDSPASDADGIITFAATVGEIRAIRSKSSSTQTSEPLYAQDDVLNALNGASVQSSGFTYLADSTAGYRRIKVPSQSALGDYRVLALKRCPTYSSLAVGDTGYDATVDYSLVGFVIDRAESALRAYLEDSLRAYNGFQMMGQGVQLLQMAKDRETKTQQREARVNPRSPMFSESDGSWRDG